MDNMPPEQPPNSALDVKLDYIQRDIGEIKRDIKEIKNDYVIRREFNDALKLIREEIPSTKDHEERIRNLESRVWKAIGALAVLQIVILPVLLFLLFKVIK